MAYDSPCISICVMSPGAGLCTGCGRTIAEIAAWPAMPPDQRRAIMMTLLSRMAAARLEPTELLQQRLADIA